MATVVTPHSFSQAAIATRSQEFAPNRRTLAGKPPASLDADGTTLATGTQTMCMSECTSMPAALGLRMVRIGACSRSGRNGLGWGLSERLRWLMVSATFLRVG